MTIRHPVTGLAPDEQPRFILHRHWSIFISHAMLVVLLAVLPIVVLSLVFPQLTGMVADRTPGGVLIALFAFFFYLFLTLYFFNAWMNYYLDIWVVTSRRIINIEQHSLFHRVVSEVNIQNVEDVTVNVKGILATMFGYGNIHVQTAGETPRFEFENVPDPYTVARHITELHNQAVPSAANTIQQQRRMVQPPSP